MILTIQGSIKSYFIQTLCMLFFPGESFSDDEKQKTGIPRLSLRVTETGEDVVCEVVVTAEGKTESFTHSEACRSAYTPEQTVKIAAGRAVYGACTALTGHKPSWGILTGVRPSKLVSKLLREGDDNHTVIKKLTEDYLVNETKAELVLSVARLESAVIDSFPPDACSIYISIPFCPSRCSYCSFVSYSTPRLMSLIPDYLKRLCDDIDLMFETINRVGFQAVSVYIGGGTPTVLTAGQLNLLLQRIDQKLKTHNPREYTLEAGRPDTLTSEKLNIAKSYGVNRISVNPQTLDDEILKLIGRNHTCDDFFHAYDITRKSGIKYINTDLIAGLPRDTFTSFQRSLDEIINLRPDNITVHTFCNKKSAELNTSVVPPNSADAVETGKSVDYAQFRTKEAGYTPYYLYRQKNTAGNLENVGYSLPACEGLYNIAVMEEIHNVFAAGAGSVTKLINGKSKIERLFMPKYPYEYLNMDTDREIKPFFFKITDFFKRRQIDDHTEL